MAEMSEQELEALARVSGGEVKDGQIVVQEDLGGEEETTPILLKPKNLKVLMKVL